VPAQATCIPAVNISTASNSICSGTVVAFNATVANAGTSGIYKWKKNNADAGVSNASYSASGFHDGDLIICEYHCKTSCGTDTTVISNTIKLLVPDEVTPIIAVSNTDTLICEGQLAVFTAHDFYGSGVPAYQWFVNDATVGINAPTYSTTTLLNGSKVECLLSVTFPGCPAVTKTARNLLSIYVYPRLHPTINILPSRTQICRGEEVVFTASANGGVTPNFAWYINGVLTGPDASMFTTSSLKNGDIVSCILTIDPETKCPVSFSAPSNTVTMEVKDYPQPSVTIAAPVLDVCSGTPVSFTASLQNAGYYQKFQWLVNGIEASENSSHFTSSQFANGDKVSCTLTTDVTGCPFNFSVNSNTETVIVRNAPVISFAPPDTAVMFGETANLHAAVSGNTAVLQWTPAAMLLSPNAVTTSTVPLFNDTTFTLHITDVNGCITTKDFVVKVLHPLFMPNAFTPNGDGKNELFRIPPGSSIYLKEFSVFDRWGKQIFKTKNVADGWDGRWQGKFADTGVYVYIIKGSIRDKEVVFKGSFILLK
jgi:gliding motility-associated-like protein